MTGASDPAVFAAAFNRLRRRFNLREDDEQAEDYFAYLSGVGLSVDEMLRCMQALWATREFFPKPADFILAFVPAEWRLVQECMDAWTEAEQWRGSKEVWPTLSTRSQDACRALGGIPAMRLQTDVVRLKASWEREFMQAVQHEAMTLPVWTAGKALAAGETQRRIGTGNL